MDFHYQIWKLHFYFLITRSISSKYYRNLLETLQSYLKTVSPKKEFLRKLTNEHLM